MHQTLICSIRLTLVAVLLAGCAAVRTAPGAAGSGPCLGQDPAAAAAAWQGVSKENPNNPYVGKDAFTNVVIDQGMLFYALSPSGKPPGFAVDEATLRGSGGSWQRYYALVQVSLDPGKDKSTGMAYPQRVNVQRFEVMQALCAAKGIAMANPQFGSGGGTQYYIVPADAAKLRPGQLQAIARWSPGQQPPP